MITKNVRLFPRCPSLPHTSPHLLSRSSRGSQLADPKIIDNRSTTMTDSSDGIAIPIYFSSVFATPTSWYSHDTGVMHMIPDPSITSPLVEENPESGDSDYIISENDVSWSATYPFMVALTAVR